MKWNLIQKALWAAVGRNAIEQKKTDNRGVNPLARLQAVCSVIENGRPKLREDNRSCSGSALPRTPTVPFTGNSQCALTYIVVILRRKNIGTLVLNSES